MDAVVLLLEMLLHLRNGNNEQRLPKFLMLEIRTSPLAVTAMLKILGGPI